MNYTILFLEVQQFKKRKSKPFNILIESARLMPYVNIHNLVNFVSFLINFFNGVFFSYAYLYIINRSYLFRKGYRKSTKFFSLFKNDTDEYNG